jgi:hypothetical protein
VHDELDLGLPPVKPKQERKAPEVKGVKWSKYTAMRRYHCDRCLKEIHEGWPEKDKAPNLAVYRRQARGVDEYLCYGHAYDQHFEDGLGRIKP